MDRRAVTLIELAIVIGIFVVMVTILAPVVQSVQDRAHKINCANKLRLISLALHTYAADHNEAFPQTLGDLYPGYIKEQGTFNCPASKASGVPERPDYAYVPGLTESSSLTEAIVYDLDNSHRYHRKNVLRVNGTIEWVKAEGKPR
jgi:type II secretory pathway pseudopilin PulG